MTVKFFFGLLGVFMGVTSLGLFYETYQYPLDLLELLFLLGSFNILVGIGVIFSD